MGKIKKGNDLSWQPWWESEWHYYARRLISAHSSTAHWENRRARLCQCTSPPNCLVYYWDVSNLFWWKHASHGILRLAQEVETWSKCTHNASVTAPMTSESSHKHKKVICCEIIYSLYTFPFVCYLYLDRGLQWNYCSTDCENIPMCTLTHSKSGSVRAFFLSWRRQNTRTHFSLVKWQRLAEYCWRRQSECHLITTRAAV